MKKRRVIIMTALCLVGSLSGFSQLYQDFNLSEYITPDIVRNELDFTLKSAGSFDDGEGSDNDVKGFNGSLGNVFKRYKNTRSFWSTQTASADFAGSYQNDYGLKNSHYNVSLLYLNTSRFYKQNNSFFEIGAYLRGGLAGTKETTTGSVTQKNHTNTVYAALPLHVGKGRIEQVEDARQAIYILENLSKRGVLTRKLTDAEIHSFAQTISTVKNKRFFDSRLRMIDEISTVDSFLVKNNFLASGGATYFTTLYDYWMYGDLFDRGSGSVFSAGITPSFGYDEFEQSVSRNRSETSVKADVSFTYEKPVNLYWQRSAYAEVYGTYGYIRNDYETLTKYNSYRAGLSGKYGWGYYPTSRTNINFGVQENIYWSKLRTIDESPALSNALLTSVSSAFVDLYYYISPQLRFSATANLGLLYNRRLEDDSLTDKDYLRWNGNFMATLTYSLF